jgi:MFS family permease
MGAAAITSGPTVLSEIVPNEFRGQLAALYLLAMAVVGLCLGPTSMALVTDHVFHDIHALRYSMIIVATVAIAASAGLAWATLRRYDDVLSERRAAFGAAPPQSPRNLRVRRHAQAP